jgi:hypothetical protein
LALELFQRQLEVLREALSVLREALSVLRDLGMQMIQQALVRSPHASGLEVST